MKYFISKMVVIRHTFSVMLETPCWHVEELTFLPGFVNLPGLAADPPRRPLLLTLLPTPPKLSGSHIYLYGNLFPSGQSVCSRDSRLPLPVLFCVVPALPLQQNGDPREGWVCNQMEFDGITSQYQEGKHGRSETQRHPQFNVRICPVSSC